MTDLSIEEEEFLEALNKIDNENVKNIIMNYVMSLREGDAVE